jgi:ElaB/YqjD/DUF883 family membrane-anchored ribosome-binding protein
MATAGLIRVGSHKQLSASGHEQGNLTMKNKIILTTIVATACAISFTGCSKSEKEAPKPATETASNAASSAVSSLKDTASQVADKAKDVAAQATDKAKEVAANVKETASKVTDAASTKFDDIVTSTKKFISEKNYQGAMDELKKLTDVQLTDSQKKTLEDLKNELQASITGGTTNAINSVKGLFGK